jgi:hypothetical protein
VSRALGLIFLFLLVVVAGCAGSTKAPPMSPVVSVAGASDAPTVSPTPVKTTTAKGPPVTAFDGDSEENSFYAPAALALRDGRFDLVIHFHGKHETTFDAIEQSGLPAVVVNVDLGADSTTFFRSTHYRDAFTEVAALDHLITFAERELTKSGRIPDAHVGRIAISAWSAGYGAAREIMQRKADVARVDALLLVDGFYGDWENKRARTVDPEDVAAALAFARRAKAGDKLFVLSHTSIDFRSYAGGPESADLLLRFLELEKVPAPRIAGQRKGTGLTYTADAAGLHVRGFKGWKWADHVAQHRDMGTLHYAELRKFWQPKN